MRKLTLPKAPPATWLQFAAEMSQQALFSYQDGEIDLREALRWTSACSKKCPDEVQVVLLGKTAQRALNTKPRPRDKRKPPYPKCLQMSAANLVLMFEEEGYPVDPSSRTGDDALTHAITWLKDLDMCKDSLAHETVYRWYLERKRQMGPLKPGRPARNS